MRKHICVAGGLCHRCAYSGSVLFSAQKGPCTETLVSPIDGERSLMSVRCFVASGPVVHGCLLIYWLIMARHVLSKGRLYPLRIWPGELVQ